MKMEAEVRKKKIRTEAPIVPGLAGMRTRARELVTARAATGYEDGDLIYELARPLLETVVGNSEQDDEKRGCFLYAAKGVVAEFNRNFSSAPLELSEDPQFCLPGYSHLPLLQPVRRLSDGMIKTLHVPTKQMTPEEFDEKIAMHKAQGQGHLIASDQLSRLKKELYPELFQ